MTFFIFNLAVKLISMSKLAFLNNTSPIFAAIIAFLFLGEAVTREQLISLGVCLLGVLILVQPYGETQSEQTENTLGSILLLISNFLNAINFCLLRMMKGIHYSIGPFYYGLLGTVVSLLLMVTESATSEGIPNRLALGDLVLFTLIGLTSALGAVFKSLAFHYEKVSTLSLIKYSNLFYSLLADVILFHSHIYIGEIIGASIILVANIMAAVMKLYQKPE